MITGLLGEKLGHSYSPEIHRLLSGCDYKLFEVSKGDLESFIKSNKYDCLNVTIPYKKDVLKFADEVSEISKRIGSANTIVKKNGKIFATNTDYYGFLFLLNKLNVQKKDKVLVLGTGGASLAVKAALEDSGYKEIVSISRSGKDNYSNLARHSDANVIVNTTPVGMYPGNMQSPIDDLGIFTSLEAVCDIIYNPKRTALILECEKRGIKCISGLAMLVAQAAMSSYYFTSVKVDEVKIDQITSFLDKKMQNIALIGMPGSGKSVVAARVAEVLARKVIDADVEFEKTFGITPAKFIIDFGENVFRKKETEVLKNISKLSGVVLSTGGGVVEREENYALLRQNSQIVYIKRDLSLLSTSSRPLSRNLDALFAHRAPLYEKFADIAVENSTNIAECASKIIKSLDFDI